ncbi:hypothetical protein BESB_008520 [Besnoitia besnoiti]|uniref:Ubiquitin-related modifier 1 n=1 Tax=Besnoitia besnoiti TaxID=94643 RepID=A0A2A9MQT4_BESBE|nr:hypothetical protein BESB_008520 [Besnoitia besnoiti]PFH38510.1 hypothetical protein BESB_008520 [Besnoitia besnoiti]
MSASQGSASPFCVTVEFCGGLEQLTTTKAKTLRLSFVASSGASAPSAEPEAPAGGEADVKLYQLVAFLSSQVVTERPDLFAETYEPMPRPGDSSAGGVSAGGVSAGGVSAGGVAAASDSVPNGSDAPGNATIGNVYAKHLLSSLPPMRVKAGVLALIDDVDVEVDGGMEATVPNGSCITFISTLHGG